jgi:C1A family cysteine protease
MGWLPDKPDQRDHRFPIHLFDLIKLPPMVDLRSQCPPVYDQGALGSCTANAIAGALEFDQIKQQEQEQVFTPSRLFIYYDERLKEGTVNSDAGAAIRDGIKSVNAQGACHESLWPYDISQFTIQPPAQCYQDALLHRSVAYQRVKQDVTHMKAALAAGYVIVFGFTVYESFESAQVASTGVVPLPGLDESVLGGHAVVAAGYRDDEQVFIVRNSWGTLWGGAMQGYCTMPYAYLGNRGLASDFWVIQGAT